MENGVANAKRLQGLEPHVGKMSPTSTSTTEVFTGSTRQLHQSLGHDLQEKIPKKLHRHLDHQDGIWEMEVANHVPLKHLKLLGSYLAIW